MSKDTQPTVLSRSHHRRYAGEPEPVLSEPEDLAWDLEAHETLHWISSQEAPASQEFPASPYSPSLSVPILHVYINMESHKPGFVSLNTTDPFAATFSTPFVPVIAVTSATLLDTHGDLQPVAVTWQRNLVASATAQSCVTVCADVCMCAFADDEEFDNPVAGATRKVRRVAFAARRAFATFHGQREPSVYRDVSEYRVVDTNNVGASRRDKIVSEYGIGFDSVLLGPTYTYTPCDTCATTE